MGHRHHYRHGHHNDFNDKLGCLVLGMVIIGFYFALFGWPAFLIGAWLASSKTGRAQLWLIPAACALLIAATYPLMNWWIISDPKDGVDEGQWIFVILGHVGGFLWGVFKPMDEWGGTGAQVPDTPTPVVKTPQPPARPNLPNQPRPHGTRTKEQQVERTAAETQQPQAHTETPAQPLPAPELPSQVTAYRGFQGITPPSPTRPFQAPPRRTGPQT